ncbi:MAG: chromosome segregation protein SMC [Bryobacterales bacterium]|nr:chromosome segregation protein SMC [Bryobacterales bacterium]
MLKLKRVEIQGFKSFCDRTEMRFHGSGIAAVVGPNGCGKSNLSDAISWVLGEQSAKSLRGARMEDVIFAGTRERKPLSMAQVTMTLVDPTHEDLQAPKIHIEHTANGHATEVHLETPNGHSNGANGHTTNGHTNGTSKVNGTSKSSHDVTITRRLYRNGDSDYLIDGRQARLRDIQDLFMGTGLGPESYAIIEQGRIGQLLSSKPHDRRAVIEEASGISKFKTKRRLAEAKLENAKQNLSRVFDILEEVGRQANSLKRQAAKAKRYQELHSELVVQLRRTLTAKYKHLEREATKIALDLNQANADYQSLSAEVNGRDKQQHEMLAQNYALESELTKTRETLAQLRLEAERTRGRIESQAREISNIENRLNQGENEGQGIEQRQQQLQEEIAAHAIRLEELEQQTEEARLRLETKTRERDQLQATLRERERGLESGRQQMLRLLSEVSGLKNQLAQVDSHLQALARDRDRLQREEQSATSDLEKLEERKTAVQASLAERQLALEGIAGKRKRHEEDLNTRKSMAGQARRDLEILRQETSNLKARKTSLEEILSHRAYTAESVKRLFSAFEHGQAHDLKPVGVLADFVDVDPNFEKAAEEFLHEELEYVIVKDWNQASIGIDLMRTDLDGRATFLVHPEPGEQVPAVPIPEPALGPATGIVARLSEVLRLTNGLTQAPAALIPRLARCFLAQDRAAAQNLAIQYPDFYFLLSDGVCFHGHAVSGGKKTGAGPLALKRELRELTSQVNAKQKTLDETKDRLETLEDEILALTDELERLRTQQQTQERETVALDHEMRRLTEEFSRAKSKLSVARLELQRVDKEAEVAVQRRDQNLAIVGEKDAARLQQEEALTEARYALEELQSQVSQAGEEHSALRIQMAEREERRRGERSAQQRLEQQMAETVRRREQIIQLIERLGVERQRLLNDNIGLDERAGRFAGEIQAIEERVATLAAQEHEQRRQLAALEEAVRAMRAEMQQAQEQRSQIEMALVQRRAELKFLDETAQKELKAPLEELAAAEETVLDEIGLAEAEDKCNSLKSKIENLGPINVDALQEYEEAQQRYDFLNTQRQDLLDSIRDTEKAIQEIDVESKRRFSEAFAIINENFKETFTKLFGGGVAEMRLTDESNVNDSGIDIVASPPGKRLQNVLLLSGGEKALTALSLLMAIFRYVPSPFCILDEVDAPLDEPNIQRLMNLLKEMSAQTQFIIITHAKRTMEAASALYGVTMQEPGVSRLVSVKFNAPPPPPQRQVLAAARA